MKMEAETGVTQGQKTTECQRPQRLEENFSPKNRIFPTTKGEQGPLLSFNFRFLACRVLTKFLLLHFCYF